jgi:DNA-binding transcriptional ArsR family regulator
VKVTSLLAWLKAAAEPTRLRLLALCSERDFSVSDLARILGQSEPRVSRHLKVLCEAELLGRVRQGQWVHYRLGKGDGAASFVQGLLAQLDRSDHTLAQDRERARLALSPNETFIAPSESRLGRAMRAFIDASRPAGSRAASAVVYGVDQLELLECGAGLARDCVAIARSRRAAQVARAFAERHGFTCRVLPAHETASLDDAPRCEALIVNHVAMPDRSLPPVLEAAHRRLAPDGQLWLFERYEALEAARDAVPARRVIEHPLAHLRRLMGESGFDCQRLTPVEADGEHILAAVAVRATAVVARTGS